jgi:hypothetical protein
MKFINSRTGAVLAGASCLVILGGVGGATAGSLIGSEQIRDNSVRSVDIHDGQVRNVDLGQGVRDALAQHARDGVNGKDGVDGKDGKDGVTNVIAGAGYTDTWVGDQGATLQTARGECPSGQAALGGGFSTWGGDKDLGGDNKNIQITVSAPYFEGDYVPVDEAGNFRPTEWVIKGYNNGTTDQIVRPWVVCANVAK